MSGSGRWALVIACFTAGVAAACESPTQFDASVTPPEGHWAGSVVSFDVQAGALLHVSVAGALACGIGTPCQNTLGCRQFTRLFAVPAVGEPFKLALRSVGAVRRISGTFGRDNRATGVLDYEVPGCCTGQVAWAATQTAASGVDLGAGCTVETGDGTPTYAEQGLRGSGNTFERAATTCTSTQQSARVNDLAWHPQQAVPDDAQTVGTALAAIRQRFGFVAPVQTALLDAVAAGHAAYYVNLTPGQRAKLPSVHSELLNSGDGYTGVTVHDRLVAAGSQWQGESQELMSLSGVGPDAVTEWMASPYGRAIVLRGAGIAIGYGSATNANGTVSADTLVALVGCGGAPQAQVVWPPPDATGVAAQWSGTSDPHAPAPPSGFPSGPVVSAHFDQQVALLTHKITDSKGKPVAHIWLDRDNDLRLRAMGGLAVALYPYKPLLAGKYGVAITVQSDAGPLARQWSFAVGP